MTFGGVISGTGSLTQLGAGTLTLTGVNTYAGLTTISAGTLQIGNGGTAGSIVGDVLDNSALGFDRSDNVTFGGVAALSSGLGNHVDLRGLPGGGRSPAKPVSQGDFPVYREKTGKFHKIW